MYVPCCLYYLNLGFLKNKSMTIHDVSIEELKREQMEVLNKIKKMVNNLVNIAKQCNKCIYSSSNTFKLVLPLVNYCKWIGLRISSDNYRDYLRIGLLNNNVPILAFVDRRYKDAEIKHQLYFVNIADRPLKLVFMTDTDVRVYSIPQLCSNAKIMLEQVFNLNKYGNGQTIHISFDVLGTKIGKGYEQLFEYLCKLRDLIYRKERLTSAIFYKIVGVPKWFVHRIFIFDRRNYRKFIVHIMTDEKLKEEVRRVWLEYKQKCKQELEKFRTKINLDLDLNFD